ncbi:hypothetical protein EDD21DRAFT_444916 [Dissophora ornata]|nr:hypothetical protein EDD21DRAFT_444916 [Dissophora ornata]
MEPSYSGPSNSNGECSTFITSSTHTTAIDAILGAASSINGSDTGEALGDEIDILPEDVPQQVQRVVANSLAGTEVDIELAEATGQDTTMMMNTLAEQETDLMIQQKPEKLLTKITVSMYQRYQRHWMEWCIRKGYPDNNVYSKKFQRYMAENKSDSTNKAMQNEPHPRSPRVRMLMKKYQLRMAELKKSTVLTDLSFDEGNNLDVLKQTMRISWTHKYRHLGGSKKHDLIGLRTRLNAAWSHYMIARGEDMRMATLADLVTHTVNQGSHGGQKAVGITLAMLRGKTNSGGKEHKGVVVRSKDVEVCPVGAFAFYLVELWMFTYKNASAMWIKSANPTNKPTHAHRGSGARHTLAAGADIGSIAQADHWSVDRVAAHYLERHSAQVALKMAGCILPGERQWLARNTLVPPIDFQRPVFPFIEQYFQESGDWHVWTSNIMTGRDIFENRPSNTRMEAKDIPKLCYA